MKTVENIRLKIQYKVIVEGKDVTRNKTFNNVSIDVSDENLKSCGDAIASFVEGNDKKVIRMEEAIVE